MKSQKNSHSSSPPLAILIAVLMLAGNSLAKAVLHTFRGGGDGIAPYGRLISDAEGNLYGTTAFGGASGGGGVFELTKSSAGWTETILYSFTDGKDGSQPWAGLIFDSAGNLYGTTYRGGAFNAGTVYELTPGQGGTWTETVLYSFASGTDGEGPQSDLTFDQTGNIYGTTNNGGSPGNGIVFELTPGQGGVWSETVLHRFLRHEGTSPRAAVVFDKKGALYGTLANNGGFNAGAVFRLEPPAVQGGAWTEKTLYHFTGQTDGYGPLCLLVRFKGSLYGTTVGGGATDKGVIFRLTPPANHHGAWTETVLHSFTCGSDGCLGWAGMIMDKKGVFYGTTQYGGPSNGGTAFQLQQVSGAWIESVLCSFNSSDNDFSAAGLLLGKNGALYGTTVGSRGNAGMVFKVTP